MKKLIFILALSSLIGFGSFLIGLLYSDDTYLYGFTIVGICTLLGITIKTMDQLIDKKKVKSNRIWIILMTIFITVAMTYLALTEEPVIGMVIGTVIGLMIAGKLDHSAYLVITLLFIALIFVAYLMQIIHVELTTFIIIPVAATGSFLDEFVHERWQSNNWIITFIFKHRFFLKVFALLGVLVEFAQPIHFIGFLCFDIFYDIIGTAYRYDNKAKKQISNSIKTNINKRV